MCVHRNINSYMNMDIIWIWIWTFILRKMFQTSSKFCDSSWGSQAYISTFQLLELRFDVFIWMPSTLSDIKQKIKVESMTGVLNLGHLTLNFYIIDISSKGTVCYPTELWKITSSNPSNVVLFLDVTLSSSEYKSSWV